jgi:oxaloacetate decarboxylase beta subunit
MNASPFAWLLEGLRGITPGMLVMLAIGGVLLYLAIVKEFEPLLLLPIGAGAILANLPFSPLVRPAACSTCCTRLVSATSCSPC